ncbi:MAG TPA: hypothetical protein PK819_13100, partial [Thermomicrobiales bacterium]|nr:hypothetical protein [Thermomicrobiales bacterium]
MIYRLLASLEELVPIEAIQRDVFGATDLDIYAAGQLMTFAEVGGHILSAWVEGKLAGALIGIGGMNAGIPKIMSDWMGLYPKYRSVGIGADLKRLQAVIALQGGYQEIFADLRPPCLRQP